MKVKKDIYIVHLRATYFPVTCIILHLGPVHSLFHWRILFLFVSFGWMSTLNSLVASLFLNLVCPGTSVFLVHQCLGVSWSAVSRLGEAGPATLSPILTTRLCALA